MTHLIPNIAFDGTAEAAFNFYKDVLGGELRMMRWSDNPHCENFSDADKQKIMHASLEIDGGSLMGNDFVPAMEGQTHIPGNNFTVTATPETREEADRIYRELSDGGVPAMPMQDMFWGGYFGFLVDKFGTQWMVHQGG